MGVVMFYHLTRSGVDETLGALLARALGQGWRVMIRGTEAEALAAIDDDEVRQSVARQGQPLKGRGHAKQGQMTAQLLGVGIILREDHDAPAGEIGCLGNHDTTFNRGSRRALPPVR